MLDLLDEIPPRTTRDANTGVPVAEFIRKARRKYGWLGGYAETEAMPGLVSRGFYESQEQLGFWKTTTPESLHGSSSSAAWPRTGGSGSACGSTTIPHEP